MYVLHIYPSERDSVGVSNNAREREGNSGVKMFPVKFIILFYVCINYGKGAFEGNDALHIITHTFRLPSLIRLKKNTRQQKKNS